MSQNTSHAVMAQRVEARDSLDFFPTPPWATRALINDVLGAENCRGTAWEPACGAGHMSAVLAETFGRVFRSDVHDYGVGAVIGSFVGEGADRAECPFRPAWIITNPPFNLAMDFAERAIGEATVGVALLVRSTWIEGVARYERIFSRTPPAIVAPFVERVPMVKGRWDPNATTATAYAWIIWRTGAPTERTEMRWVPPGRRRALTRADDVARFAGAAA